MRRPAFAFALALALAGTTAPSLVHAQPLPGKEHAKRLFEEGVELERKGDYAGALAKYKDAESIAVTAGLRFHKGYCLEMTGKLSAALDEYEGADKLARDQNKQDVRAAVAARLEPLRARIPHMAIRLTPPVKDAEVQLDGATVGAGLLDGKGFRVDPGDHKVVARAPGHKPYTREVHVVESATTNVDIALETDGGGAGVPAAAPAGAGAGAGAAAASGAEKSGYAGTTTEPPHEAARSRSLALPIATTAGAVVLAGVGVAMFAVAGGAKSDADVECPQKLDCDSERSKIRTFDTLALGSFIGAAGLAVVSIVLWTKSGSSSASAPRTQMVATPSSVGIAGSF